MAKYCWTFSILLALILYVAPIVRSQCLSKGSEELDKELDKKLSEKLFGGEEDFTLSLLKAVNDATPNENIFISPYSIYFTLLLAYFGSNGTTEDSLKDILKLDWIKDKNNVIQAYKIEKQMREKRFLDKSTEFISADKVFLSKHTEINKCLKDVLFDEIEGIDFVNDPENCRNYINNWIANITNDNIKDMLSPGSVNEQTNLVLANAAYFKGMWASKFDPKFTNLDIFYTTQKIWNYANMMAINGTFNYGIYEKLKVQILELPFSSNSSEVSMIIILPHATNGINDVINNLNKKNLKELLANMREQEVNVKLPKFSFEKSLELRPILEKIGAGKIFSPDADFSTFSETNKLNLDDSKHKAKIIVDEEGSTAAASTVIFSFRSSRPLTPNEFHCKYPFIFLIYDNYINSPLFTGIYRIPETNSAATF